MYTESQTKNDQYLMTGILKRKKKLADMFEYERFLKTRSKIIIIFFTTNI